MTSLVVAQAIRGVHAIMYVLSTGGSGCVDADETAFRVTYPGSRCLGFFVSDHAIATAAHCLPDVADASVNVTAVCAGTTKQTVPMSCKRATPVGPTADLAICSAEALPPDCQGSRHEDPQWQMPLAAAPTLQVMGVGQCGLELNAAASETPWPTDKNVFLQAMFLQGVTIDSKDSGAPVFDSAAKPRKVIAIVVMVNEKKKPAQLVPLYHWPDLKP